MKSLFEPNFLILISEIKIEIILLAPCLLALLGFFLYFVFIFSYINHNSNLNLIQQHFSRKVHYLFIVTGIIFFLGDFLIGN